MTTQPFVPFVPNELDVVGHMVIVHDETGSHVQHHGPEHRVEGSETILFDLPPGYQLVVRFSKPPGET